jgi:pimeloyl-ACP methyl ester carboxylesterase
MSLASPRSHRGEPTPAATLAHDRLGAGPALVLIHPLGTDRRVWEPVLEPLSRARTVIAVDLPGFGASPPLVETPTPGALARALERFFADLELPLPHVAGNSLGGWIALELALAGRVSSVTAIAPAGLWRGPLAPKPNIARVLAGAVRPVLPLLTATAAGRRALLGGSILHPERVPAAAAAHLISAYARAPGFVATNQAMRAGHFDGLDRIEVPVTLGWPDHDRLVSPPAQLLGRAGPIRSRVLVGCGHVPMWDAPDQVTALLLEGSGG